MNSERITMLLNTKSLLIVSAVIESATGLLLLIAPSLTAQFLLGAGLPSPESLLVGRVAGAALVAIALACWLERNRDAGGSAIGLVAGLLCYNAVVIALLFYATLVGTMKGFGTWPALLAHSALLVWSMSAWKRRPR